MKALPVSKHLTHLVVKFVFFTIVLALLVPAGTGGRYTFGGVLWLSAALTLLAYFVGDRWILPGYGNWTAVFADAGLAALGLWALPAILGTPGIPFGTIVMAALLLGVGEFYFHRYLQGDLPMAAPAGGPMGEGREGGGEGRVPGRGGGHPGQGGDQGRDQA